MKKSILKAVIAALLFFTDISFTTGQITFDSEIEKFGINRYMLQNNLEVFTKEDYSSALVRIELTVKAGFSSQTPETTGYFSLLSRILFDKKDFPEVQASCNADSTTFIIETTPAGMEKKLEQLSKQITSPFFSDTLLKNEYESMKKEVTEYAESTTGFVNSAIDSQIFSEEPWKQDSGIYPSLFSSNQLSQLRTELFKITKDYYIPQNSAIFISGCISSETASKMASKYFSSWKTTSAQQKQQDIAQHPDAETKKFVLLDEGFSEELTQIVIQFTTLSINQTEIFASSFTDITSPYKNLILQNEMLAVRGQTYLTAASAVKGKDSRLILQAIMEKPFSLSENKELGKQKVTVPEQAETFLTECKKAAILNEYEFTRAKSTVESKYKTQTGNSGSLMEYLAEIWASGLERKDISQENLQDLSEQISKEEPYLFILVNPAVYKAQKQSFAKAGYKAITKNNASWYTNTLIMKKAFETTPETKKNCNEDNTYIPSALDYYNTNKMQFTSFNLKNNIPVVLKKNTGTNRTVISISITGGELSSPYEERFLRTTLINSFAQNIQTRINILRSQNKFHGDTPLKAWTEETTSYITISCMNSDITPSLTAVSEAILLSEVTPVNADSLVYEQKMLWTQKSAYLDYQMKCAALSALYSGTEFEKLFDASSSILKKTTYRTFSLDYMQLLDASLYGIVITGDIDEKEITDSLEKTFGILRQQTVRRTIKAEKPEITKTERKVKLRHTFTTDIPAELAGPAPQTLVPTKDFSDPVQFWISCPSEPAETAVLNALLFELEERIQNKLKEQTECISIPAGTIIQTACIQCNGILHTDDFKNAYSSAVNELLSSLKADDTECIQRIKDTWILRIMNKTSDEEGTASLIQESILSGNIMQYLINYQTVENTDSAKFYELAEKYFLTAPVYEIYSTDSQN